MDVGNASPSAEPGLRRGVDGVFLPFDRERPRLPGVVGRLDAMQGAARSREAYVYVSGHVKMALRDMRKSRQPGVGARSGRTVEGVRYRRGC